MNTAAAAAVLLSLFLFPAAPGSVMLPLREVVVLEDDEEVLVILAAESMSKCSLVSSWSEASVTEMRGLRPLTLSLMFELLQENFWSIGMRTSDLYTSDL